MSELAQFVLEVLLPLVFEIICNLISFSPSGRVGFISLLFAISMVVGGVSGAAIGSPFGNNAIVQTAAVIFGPILLAGGSELLFRKREAAGRARPSLGSFWVVYWLAFGFLGMRSLVLHGIPT